MSENKPHIILHPQYGLNPTIRVCFWCSEETNEIVILGNKCKDQAPRSAVVGYKPCEKCLAEMAKGILIAEIMDKPYNETQPKFSGHYPSGSWMVVLPDFIRNNLADETIRERVLANGRLLMSAGDFQSLLQAFKNYEKHVVNLRNMEPQGHA
jgi:hypothetical protein